MKEGRVGLLVGQKTALEKKPFRSIQIVGYEGPVVVRISCVSEDFTMDGGMRIYQPHSHSLTLFEKHKSPNKEKVNKNIQTKKNS